MLKNKQSTFTIGIFLRILSWLKPYCIYVLVSIIVALTSVFVDIYLVYLIRNLIDFALESEHYRELVSLLYKMGIVILIGIVASYMNSYIVAYFSSSMMYDIRKNVIHHLKHYFAWKLDHLHSGELMSRLTNDLTEVQNFFENHFLSLFYQPLVFLSAFTFMAFIDWKMLVFCIIMVPITIYLTRMISKPISKYNQQFQRKLAVANSIVQDSLNSYEVVKSYQAEQFLFGKYKEVIKLSLQDKLSIVKQRTKVSLLIFIVQIIPFIICLVYGSYVVIIGELSIGSFLIFFYLLNYLVRPVIVLQETAADFRIAVGSAQRVFDLLDQPIEIISEENNESSLNHHASPIEFENVVFQYVDGNPVLNEISFTIPHHKITAIVGLSGSGKSTIFKLMNRFVDINEGSIYVYGRNVMDLSLPLLRDQIAVVAQQSDVFGLTVFENIALGNTSITLDEVIEAAQLANAHEFIMELPYGYKTMIGEHGVELSGGEKQRISIARALLKKAPILLLDEPTSALDHESEQTIIKNLQELRNKMTIIVISHRPNTLSCADQILVLDNGNIIQKGSHEHLMNNTGLYQKLFDKESERSNKDAYVK